MAFFKTTDLLKGNSKYVEVLVETVRERGEMIVGAFQDGTKIKLRNKIIIGSFEYNVTQRTKKEVQDTLKAHLLSKDSSPPWVVDSKGNQHSLIALFRDSRFVPESRVRAGADVRGKAFQQRQEINLVALINDITLDGPKSIHGVRGSVYGAEQAPEMSNNGKENLVDIVLFMGASTGSKVANVSCKQTKAADLGGGGMTGLNTMVPDLVKKLYARLKQDLESDGFVEGGTYDTKDIPTYVYEIPSQYLTKIMRGHDKIGGTIDYMYIGPPEVTFLNGQLNGNFIDVDTYARQNKFYFRLRTRDVIQNKVKIDFKKKNREGFPSVFVTGPSGSNAARVVVEIDPPLSAKKRKL